MATSWVKQIIKAPLAAASLHFPSSSFQRGSSHHRPSCIISQPRALFPPLSASRGCMSAQPGPVSVRRTADSHAHIQASTGQQTTPRAMEPAARLAGLLLLLHTFRGEWQRERVGVTTAHARCFVHDESLAHWHYCQSIFLLTKFLNKAQSVQRNMITMCFYLLR